MEPTKQTSTLMECFDGLANAPFMAIHRERYELAQSIIDTLETYPRPAEKGEDREPTPVLCAYLHISIARNTLKLALLGGMSCDMAFASAYKCFELALSLLTANK